MILLDTDHLSVLLDERDSRRDLLGERLEAALDGAACTIDLAPARRSSADSQSDRLFAGSRVALRGLARPLTAPRCACGEPFAVEAVVCKDN